MPSQQADEYKWFPVMHPQPWCWWCGRGPEVSSAPGWWHAVWLIERAHIVNKPRIEDRRAVVLLCSLCHQLSHGATLTKSSEDVPSLGHMLWLKSTFDPGFYNRAWLARCSVRGLPCKRRPSRRMIELYESRRGMHPGLAP